MHPSGFFSWRHQYIVHKHSFGIGYTRLTPRIEEDIWGNMQTTTWPHIIEALIIYYYYVYDSYTAPFMALISQQSNYSFCWALFCLQIAVITLFSSADDKDRLHWLDYKVGEERHKDYILNRCTESPLLCNNFAASSSDMKNIKNAHGLAVFCFSYISSEITLCFKNCKSNKSETM